MANDKIYGKILALTKEYNSREIAGGLVRRFFTRSRMPPLLGMGLSWWLTPRGLEIRDDLARMLVAKLSHLAIDIETATRTIERVLQDNGDNSGVFAPYWFENGSTMFDGKGGSERQFASALWNLFREALEASVTDWLIVVAFPKVRSRSVDIGFDDLLLVAATDVEGWQAKSVGYQNASRWDPRSGVIAQSDPKIHGEFLPETWGVCRATGTERGANQAACERFRTFVALLFAISYPLVPLLLTKTRAEPLNACTQFASTASRGGIAQVWGEIGELVPITFGEIDVTPERLDFIQGWYERRNQATEERQRRAIVASHFLHYGLVADELEQFIHFFIALDALFGVRHQVEATVIAGVNRAFAGDAAWSARAKTLFKLRNDLIHGGSSTIEMWPHYDEYLRRFRSRPLQDIAIMATTAFRTYFL